MIDRYIAVSPNHAGPSVIRLDPKGDLIRLVDVQAVLAAALELELYGATVSRLQKLRKELNEVLE